MSALKEAVALLRDEHLVWSEDMEVIRRPLADLLEKIGHHPMSDFHEQVDDLLFPLLGYERTSAPRDPLEAWMNDAQRHLTLLDGMAEQSPSFKEALKKLFRAL